MNILDGNSSAVILFHPTCHCAEAITLRILGISGSTHKYSFNTALLTEAEKILPDGATLEVADISSLPLFNPDREDDPPQVVLAFKEKIRRANAVLFATPEYNRSVTAALKNAIEWGNRPDNAWDGKPAAIISASTGLRGGARGQLHLRQILVDLNMYAMNGPELFVGNAREAFDENLTLKDERARKTLRAVLEGLVNWSARLGSK